MEGIIEFAYYLAENPILSALIEIASVIGLVAVWRSGILGRSKIHTRLDEGESSFAKHEKTCAERWGVIKTELTHINNHIAGTKGKT